MQPQQRLVFTLQPRTEIVRAYPRGRPHILRATTRVTPTVASRVTQQLQGDAKP